MLIYVLSRGDKPPNDDGTATIMARLNALFPATPISLDSSETDMSPCSPGLRDSIRLLVYEHLMSGEPFNQDHKDSISQKLVSWCNIPDYETARELLLRYTEEVKKLETTCLATLHSVEVKFSNTLGGASPSRFSYVSSSDQSYKTPDPFSPTSPPLSTPDTSGIHDRSTISTYSSTAGSRASTSSTAFSPLLHGMPGREISPAKTDGAAFTLECDVPPVLVYPDDLSKTEFYVHPLAPYLDFSTNELAWLGLVIPKERSSRDF